MRTPVGGQDQPSNLSNFLEKWPWFNALPEDLKSLVQRTALEKTATAGEYIARSGAPSEHWYGVMRGFLQMYVVGPDGHETTLYCLREGEWGGEGSLLKQELRRYDLRSLTPSHICLLPIQTFETLRRSSLGFNHFLCELMNARMGEFVGMLAASRLLGPEMRVARALLMLAGDRSQELQELSIPQHEIALICGLSRQRVNVALNVFKRRGLVHGESHKGFLVVDVPHLRKFFMEAS